MFAPDFVTFDNWEEMADFQKSVVKNQLRAQLRGVLGEGVHTFGSVTELFGSTGIEHLATGQVEMRSTLMKSFRIGSTSCHFRMSNRRFASLVHHMKDVRLRQFSHEAVDREGAPRIMLVIS